MAREECFPLLPYYLILCRSLTYAQRTASVLARVGITAPIQRAPGSIAEEGCTHALRVTEQELHKALAALARANMTPSRIFLNEQDGRYREVAF